MPDVLQASWQGGDVPATNRMAGAVMDSCPEIPDCLHLGWLWDPYAEGGPAWLLYARWQDETMRQIEATWDDGIVSISW